MSTIYTVPHFVFHLREDLIRGLGFSFDCCFYGDFDQNCIKNSFVLVLFCFVLFGFESYFFFNDHFV